MFCVGKEQPGEVTTGTNRSLKVVHSTLVTREIEITQERCRIDCLNSPAVSIPEHTSANTGDGVLPRDSAPSQMTLEVSGDCVELRMRTRAGNLGVLSHV